MKTYFVAAVVALAAAAPAAARDFAGPYVGAGVTVDNVQGSGPNEGLGASGVGGTLFAGYDLRFGGAGFGGVEANADLYSADVTADLGSGPVTVKAKWGWGVSARLGYLVNESTGLYARVGYARGKIGAEAGGVSDSAWGDGVRYGAGVETSLSKNLSLRAEFSQFNYESDIINNQATLGIVYGF